MTSRVSICNKALNALGANFITSLDDDTIEAKILSNIYDSTLRSVLSQAPWSFAIKSSNLAYLPAITVPFTRSSMAFYFQMPSDYINLIRVYPDYAKYRIEGDRLLSDCQTVGITYTYYNNNPASYTSSFVDVLSLKLAIEASYNINNSETQRDVLIKLLAGQILPKAISENSLTSNDYSVTDDYWVNSRYQNRAF